MSRNGDKKKVPFSTHIIAGGVAGACEAVSIIASWNSCGRLKSSLSAGMSTSRYHQGSHAAIEVGEGHRGTFVHPDISPCPVIHIDCAKTRPRGFLATGAYIVKRETPLALYKGLGAVLSGIVPKMAIRFASFEAYKGWLADKETGKTSVGGIFIGASLRSFWYESRLTSPFPIL